ncbi:MAG TPA: adenylate cyclase regulatory domain-containing protein, partial [Mycobacterium sp.]|nr:adenylate cyclase regulatory domain-containing protein [Mycobacterium sp.]
MAEEFDIEASGLLDGLEGKARAERAELIPWLLEHGVTFEQIRNAIMPALLASRRLLGDDGTYVSARETSEKTGIDLELLQRIQRAMGLPSVDDPDAPVYLRADAEAAAFAQKALELGIDADQLVQITRTLTEGLSRAAEAMRYAALATILDPTATELEVAKNSEALVREVAPMLGPMIHEMLRVQLRHLMETEAVTASERAEGQ